MRSVELGDQAGCHKTSGTTRDSCDEQAIRLSTLESDICPGNRRLAQALYGRICVSQ